MLLEHMESPVIAVQDSAQLARQLARADSNVASALAEWCCRQEGLGQWLCGISGRLSAEGIELVLQKFYDIDSMTIKYRMDTLFGVVNKNPEMSGILLFNQ